MSRSAVAAILLVGIEVTAAHSQGPSPAPAKGSQTKQQQADTAQTQTAANNQPSKNPPAAIQQPTPEIVRYQQHLGYEDKGDASPDWPSWAVAFFTFGLLVLAVFQWLAMRRQAKLIGQQADLMGKQLAEMKTTSADTHVLAIQSEKTASAAEKSAEATRDLVQVIQRAWIAVEVAMSEGMDAIQFIDNNLVVATKFTLTNVGRTVANKIELRAEILLRRNDHEYEEVHAIQSKLASQPPTNVGQTMFPDQADKPHKLLFIGREQIESAVIDDCAASGVQRIAPVIVGCVVYEYPNSPKHHATRFAYAIARKEPGLMPPPPFVPSIEVGVNLSANQVELSRFYFGGGEAD